MARLSGWRAALVRKIASGDCRRPQGNDPARTLNDAIAYLRGAPRDEGESFQVVVHCLRETRKWRYRLTYGGSQYNIIAEWIEP
jgi:hypothetical protein